MTHRYNHFVKKILSASLCSLAFLLLSSCAKDIQNTEAVRQGVIDYLKQRSTEIGIDMNAMDVKVTSATFEKDVARAAVSFVPKGMPEGAGMAMNYVFDRKGDKWAVRRSESGMATPHGGEIPGGAPTGHPPSGMPAGHPPNGMPEGHPPAGTTESK